MTWKWAVTLFWIKYPRCLGFLWLWSRNNLILRLYYRKKKKIKVLWNEHTWLIYFWSYLEFQQPSIFLRRPKLECFRIGSIELKIHQTAQSDSLLKLKVRQSQKIEVLPIYCFKLVSTWWRYQTIKIKYSPVKDVPLMIWIIFRVRFGLFLVASIHHWSKHLPYSLP